MSSACNSAQHRAGATRRRWCSDRAAARIDSRTGTMTSCNGTRCIALGNRDLVRRHPAAFARELRRHSGAPIGSRTGRADVVHRRPSHRAREPRLPAPAPSGSRARGRSVRGHPLTLSPGKGESGTTIEGFSPQRDAGQRLTLLLKDSDILRFAPIFRRSLASPSPFAPNQHRRSGDHLLGHHPGPCVTLDGDLMAA